MKTGVDEIIENSFKYAFSNGQFVSITGKVLSGKTTLMRATKRLIDADNWGVVCTSYAVEKEKIKLKQLDTAMIYDLSVEKNIHKITISNKQDIRVERLLHLIEGKNKPVILFIDDAHEIKESVLVDFKDHAKELNDSLPESCKVSAVFGCLSGSGSILENGYSPLIYSVDYKAFVTPKKGISNGL